MAIRGIQRGPVTRYDHCLVKVEWREQRNDYTALPFTLRGTRRGSWSGETAGKSPVCLSDLVRQVAVSPI